MSKLEVDTIAPQSGTQVTLGESGDTITIPAGATFDASSGTLTLADGSVTNAKLAGSITNDKLTNSSITINGSSVSLGGSTTIETGTSWQSDIKTSAFTAVAGEGYWINTTSAAVTMTLPASASVGDTIEFSDYARTWNTNNVTVNPNNLNYQGNSSPNPVYDVNGQSVRIVYSGATQGWIPTSDDDVSLETPQLANIDYLVIAGGGGGGNTIGGGGGAGGMISATNITITKNNIFTATIGAGHPGNETGGSGTNTTLASNGLPNGTTITAIGGGNGGGHGTNNTGPGADGGSGGGGGANASSGTNQGGSGTSGQGNDGGSANNDNYGGGGGGKGGAGTNSTGSSANGGTSSSNSITGSAVDYAGGGAGGSRSGLGTASGGGGGAGNGGNYPNNNGGDATANTGSGGGGPTGNGGSGVVIIRIPTADYTGTTTGSPTITTDGTDTIIKFTGTGTYSA